MIFRFRTVLMLPLIFSVSACSDSTPETDSSIQTKERKADDTTMSASLQERAKAFLKRPIPKGMPYVPDSMSERFIVMYAEKGSVDLDAELTELLEICVVEGERAANEKSGAEQEFFKESAAILRAILAESRGRR